MASNEDDAFLLNIMLQVHEAGPDSPQHRIFHKSMEALYPHQRAFIRGFYLEGKTPTQIAEGLQTTVDSVQAVTGLRAPRRMVGKLLCDLEFRRLFPDDGWTAIGDLGEAREKLQEFLSADLAGLPMRDISELTGIPENRCHYYFDPDNFFDRMNPRNLVPVKPGDLRNDVQNLIEHLKTPEEKQPELFRLMARFSVALYQRKRGVSGPGNSPPDAPVQR